MIFVAEEMAAGKVSPSRFFERWPDISGQEDKDVRELWLSASYFESDMAGGAETAEFYRQAILKFSSRLRERLQLEKEKESNQSPEPTVPFGRRGSS